MQKAAGMAAGVTFVVALVLSIPTIRGGGDAEAVVYALMNNEMFMTLLFGTVVLLAVSVASRLLVALVIAALTFGIGMWVRSAVLGGYGTTGFVSSAVEKCLDGAKVTSAKRTDDGVLMKVRRNGRSSSVSVVKTDDGWKIKEKGQRTIDLESCTS